MNVCKSIEGKKNLKKMSGTKRVRKQGKLIRYIYGPIRVLARARDLYVNSLTGPVVFGNSMGCPTPQHIPSVPRSYSVNKSNPDIKTTQDELRDLVMLSGKLKPAELHRSKSTALFGGGGGAAAPVPRSKTVAFGRIDEDSVYEFGDREEDEVGLLGGRGVDYRSNNSYAVRRRIN